MKKVLIMLVLLSVSSPTMLLADNVSEGKKLTFDRKKVIVWHAT